MIQLCRMRGNEVTELSDVTDSHNLFAHLNSVLLAGGTQKLHKHMKCHFKARHLMNAESCECVVGGGNEPSTTVLTTAASNSAFTKAKSVETWSTQNATCSPVARKCDVKARNLMNAESCE
jgi:hypothetical protein